MHPCACTRTCTHAHARMRMQHAARMHQHRAHLYAGSQGFAIIIASKWNRPSATKTSASWEPAGTTGAVQPRTCGRGPKRERGGLCWLGVLAAALAGADFDWSGAFSGGRLGAGVHCVASGKRPAARARRQAAGLLPPPPTVRPATPPPRPRTSPGDSGLHFGTSSEG
jgi:hypothetical protein